MKDMIKHFHESNLIEGIDNPLYDAQVAFAWDYISKVKELNRSSVCKIQKIITLLQDDLMPHQRGYTRSMSKVNVYIGDHVAPSWWLVDGMLDNWLLDMKEHWQTLTPKEMHIRYEHIHPFADGNGRSGRMLMWWHEKKLGLEPSLILNETKYKEYYPWFQK